MKEGEVSGRVGDKEEGGSRKDDGDDEYEDVSIATLYHPHVKSHPTTVHCAIS